jgi:hypothetical protein
VLCCLALCLLASRAAEVTASLDRPTVALGETVTLTITFDGVGTAGQPQLPPIPNFQVVGTGQRTEMGPGYMRLAFDYQLQPAQPGDFAIPGFQVQAGGRTYATKPLQVKVLKPGSAVPGADAGAPSAFLKLVVPKTEVYAGEMFPVEIQLYAQEGRFDRPQLAGDGFSFGRMPEHTQSQTTVNGRRYNLVVFKVAAMPVRMGTLTLGPATMSLQVSDRSRRPDFFGFTPQRRVALATDPVAIRVLPLPTQNVPAGFGGTVGSYSLQVSAGPTNVAVGDPITVKVLIAGSGPLESLALPAQPDWREFKTYPPESELSFSDALGLSGTKTFKQVVIPQNHEVKLLPPFLFTFFDPAAKAFRTLKGPAIPLEVRTGGSAPGPLPTLAGVTNRSETAEKTQEIVPIKVHLGALGASPTLLVREGWFWCLQLAPPALWLGFLARRKYRDALSRNPRLQRQRQVARLLREGLDELRRHAAAREPEQFFALLFRLLQEQIGERLDMPASAITEAVVDERLRPLAVEEELLAQVHQLFQECNLARYAPAHSAGELEAIIPRLQSALEGLRQLPGPEPNVAVSSPAGGNR